MIDTANLSIYETVAALSASLAALGAGAAAGVRMFPALRSIPFRGIQAPPRVALESPPKSSRLIPTDILALEGNVLRYRDGSYAKAYRFAPAPTIFDDETLTETRADELRSLLKFDKPAGTIIQFRFSNRPDDGRVLRNHLRSRGTDGADPVAGLLQATNLTLLEDAVRRGEVRTQEATVWIRVPTRHAADSGMFARFLPTLRDRVRTTGFFGFLLDPVLIGKNAFAEGFVVRERRAEAECRTKARRAFQAFEANFPKELGLRELSRAEIFAEIVASHRRERGNLPSIAPAGLVDVRRYLAGAEIRTPGDAGGLVVHNGALASVVSLKSLPNGFVTADMMRYLTAARNLRFPFEIVVDLSANEKTAARKDLQKRIERVDRSRNTWLGFRQLKKDAVVIKAQLENLLEEVEGDDEEICTLRMNVIVYGAAPRSKREFADAARDLDDRCDRMIAAIRRRCGADAVREDAARQRALYPRMLAGELSTRPTGQELVETADSVIAFVPAETSWKGSDRPHSVFVTPSGMMFGLDLFDRALIKSPTVIVTAASGEGKSFLATSLITDIRAHRGGVRVRVMDYRYSFKPICRLFGGRHIEFDERSPKPINIWNYPGLETGRAPSKRQLAMVLTDILILSRTPRGDAITSAIASTVIDEVYKLALARNGRGRPKFQPTFGHFLDCLKSHHWSSSQKSLADELYLKLNVYRKDPWINAPTDRDYDRDSAFDVFELSGISGLDEKIRESVGFRISARIMQEIGEEDDAGQKTPILFICDEVREINKHFPAISELIAEATVTGRKEGLVTMLFSQAYEHFTGTPERPNETGIDLVKNSGVKIVGKQIGGFERLADDCELSKETIAAIRAIRNRYGEYTQWVMIIGSGVDKIVEMAELHASPAMLWANTNDTNEANARRLAENLRPDVPLAIIVSWLAARYPRGLTAIGLTALSEGDIDDLKSGEIA